jgi:hypothetical protein
VVLILELSAYSGKWTISHNSSQSERPKKETSFEQPYINNFYIGYYDGGIRFCDGESSGIEVFTIEELEKQIAEEPTKFTEDLKWMIKRYRHLLVPLNTKKGPTYAFKK